MPRMDGIQLTGRMRATARTRDIPVILLTARESEDDRLRGMQAGADAYLTKSAFDQAALLETIQRLLPRKEAGFAFCWTRTRQQPASCCRRFSRTTPVSSSSAATSPAGRPGGGRRGGGH